MFHAVSKRLLCCRRLRLVLMRHAESEDTADSTRDHDRQITPAGRAAAQQVRRFGPDAVGGECHQWGGKCAVPPCKNVQQHTAHSYLAGWGLRPQQL